MIRARSVAASRANHRRKSLIGRSFHSLFVPAAPGELVWTLSRRLADTSRQRRSAASVAMRRAGGSSGMNAMRASTSSRWDGALLIASLLATAVSGCAGASHTETGALVGTSLGALAGAVIGNQSGNAETGAILGAGAGLMTGAAIGSAEDAREERDWAIRQAEYAQAQRSAAPPLTNADLIYMTQNGLGDQVIINSVKSRGGQFHLDPASLVQLKQNGVSDAVIVSIQSMSQSPAMPMTTTRVAAPTTSRVVIVQPVAPVVGVGFGFGSSCGPHSHWHARSHW
jgi:hypothetical protein